MLPTRANQAASYFLIYSNTERLSWLIYLATDENLLPTNDPVVEGAATALGLMILFGLEA